MRRRTYVFETIQVILCILIIAASVVLFLNYNSMEVLFPAVFGLAALLAFLYAFEGVWYNKNRVIKKSRSAVFLTAALILILFLVLSILVIF